MVKNRKNIYMYVEFCMYVYISVSLWCYVFVCICMCTFKAGAKREQGAEKIMLTFSVRMIQIQILAITAG